MAGTAKHSNIHNIAAASGFALRREVQSRRQHRHWHQARPQERRSIPTTRTPSLRQTTWCRRVPAPSRPYWRHHATRFHGTYAPKLPGRHDRSCLPPPSAASRHLRGFSTPSSRPGCRLGRRISQPTRRRFVDCAYARNAGSRRLRGHAFGPPTRTYHQSRDKNIPPPAALFARNVVVRRRADP